MYIITAKQCVESTIKESKAYWITKCFVFRGILRGPSDKPCLVSSARLFTTSLGFEWERYYGQPILDQDLPGGPPGDPQRSPWGSVGGGTLITRCSIFLVPKGGLWGSLMRTLFSSVQFFKNYPSSLAQMYTQIYMYTCAPYLSSLAQMYT